MLGEVENSSFIALSDKGGHSGTMPSNRVILPEEGSEEFYSNVFKKHDQLTDILLMGW